MIDDDENNPWRWIKTAIVASLRPPKHQIATAMTENRDETARTANRAGPRNNGETCRSTLGLA